MLRNENRSPYYLLQQIRMALFATANKYDIINFAVANKDDISYLLQQVSMTLFATANKYRIAGNVFEEKIFAVCAFAGIAQTLHPLEINYNSRAILRVLFSWPCLWYATFHGLF